MWNVQDEVAMSFDESDRRWASVLSECKTI